MLFGELKFYKNHKVIKLVGDEEFSEYNPEQLSEFVKTIAVEIGADKVISSCVYHGGAKGTIDTILFPLENATPAITME